MASNINQAPAFLLTALILFAAANPLSHALPGLLSPVLGGASGVVNSVTPVVPAVTGAAGGVVPIVTNVTGTVGGVESSLTPVVPSVTSTVTGVTGSSSVPPSPVSGCLSGLNVSGYLCCTANGNCPAGATGFVGAPVKVNCTNLVGTSVTVGQGVTGANGGFNITVDNLLSTLGGLINPNSAFPCNVVVPIPLKRVICPALSLVNGTLNGALSIVDSATQAATVVAWSVSTV